MALATEYTDSQIQKWQPTGWRVVQKYSLGVLLGNWYESRLGKFHRGAHPSCGSTNQDSYQRYHGSSYFPDVSTRRKGQLRNDGLNKDQIFTHHDDRYSQNRISSYDQDYNRKYCMGLRQWNLRRVAWLPETSDHPVQGNSTNYGLREEKEKRNEREREESKISDSSPTIYRFSYREHPGGFTSKRAATPRHLSAHFHPHNLNKNLQLRGRPLIATPEVVDPKLLKLSSTV